MEASRSSRGASIGLVELHAADVQRLQEGDALLQTVAFAHDQPRGPYATGNGGRHEHFGKIPALAFAQDLLSAGTPNLLGVNFEDPLCGCGAEWRQVDLALNGWDLDDPGVSGHRQGSPQRRGCAAGCFGVE